ncbi:hypothetical protein BDV28DRAFT_141876 [Aspergillus coremiiformis]|uniref:Uncharacterized protein n=1 Tax=Aspergillus coremiiformis TaxID=138285 RepID=A0A5N6YUF1_9EURO|nr:hypothetical protein BDV28DRAFT_141876 [Aspergillus coremiiformis]
MKPHPCNPEFFLVYDLITAAEVMHLFGALALAGRALAGGAAAATVIGTYKGGRSATTPPCANMIHVEMRW